MSDDSPSQVTLSDASSALMQGKWVRGAQPVYWTSADQGSGLRFERVRVDGAALHVIDNGTNGQCNAAYSQANGEYARTT